MGCVDLIFRFRVASAVLWLCIIFWEKPCLWPMLIPSQVAVFSVTSVTASRIPRLPTQETQSNISEIIYAGQGFSRQFYEAVTPPPTFSASTHSPTTQHSFPLFRSGPNTATQNESALQLTALTQTKTSREKFCFLPSSHIQCYKAWRSTWYGSPRPFVPGRNLTH